MYIQFHQKRFFHLLSVVTALFAIVAISGCGSKQAASDQPIPIKIGYSPGVCNAPLFVAYENGFLADEGLAPEMVQVDAAHISDAVGAGQVDAFQGLASKLVQPLENGLPAKVVIGLHTGCQRLLVPKDSPIQTIADLKGKKIGVPGLADAATIITKRALYREGIGVTDKNLEVEFAVFNRNDLPQALEKGAVDAIGIGDPAGPIAIEQYGLRTIIDTAKTEPFASEYCCVGLVTNKLAAENPDAAAKFVRALAKASAWVQKHPQEAAQLELDKKYVAGNIELNTSLLESYNYTPSVQGGLDAVKAVAGELAAIGLIPPDTDAQKFMQEHSATFDGVPDTPDPDAVS